MYRVEADDVDQSPNLLKQENSVTPLSLEWRVPSEAMDDRHPPPGGREKSASMYVATWEVVSGDVLGRYLDDIRYFNLLSSDDENRLCRRIVKLRARASRALLRAPTALPAFTRLVQQIGDGEVARHQVIRPVEPSSSKTDETELTHGLCQLRQQVADLQKLAVGMAVQPGQLRSDGRVARQAYLEGWDRCQRQCDRLLLQPYGYEVLQQALERGEGVDPNDPQLLASRQVWHRVQSQLTQAKSRMVHANLRLVIYLATRFKDRGVPLPDLIQEGNLGLMRAIDKFDPERGVKFVTYAHWWVRQAISRAIVDQSRTVRIPSYMIDRKNKLRTETARLWEALHRSPNTDELSAALGWTRQEVETLQMVSQPMTWLHTPVTEDGHGLDEVIEDVQSPRPGARLDAEQLQHCLTECLNLLPERQTFILRLRYGFETGKTHSLQEIASIMGLSRERVRQLEKAAFTTLRQSQYGAVLADFINVS